MEKIGSTAWDVDLDDSSFQKGVARVNKGADSMSESIGLSDIALGSFIGNLASSALQKGIQTVEQLGTAFIGMAGSALQAASDLQQNRISFEVMLGSAEKAKTLLKDLTQFAKETPFQLTELQDSTKQLLAFGIAQEEIIPTMKTLGNISAGVGKDKLPTLIRALGKAKSSGKLMGDTMMMLTDAGVGVKDMLATKLGIPLANVDKAISDGRVSFEMFKGVLDDMAGPAGRFDGLMQKQMNTFEGFKSNLGDTWDQLMRTFGGITETGDVVKGGFLDSAGNALREIGKFVDDHHSELEQIGAQLGEGIGTLVRELLPKLLEMLPGLVSGFGDFVKSVNDDMPNIATRFEQLKTTIEAVAAAFKLASLAMTIGLNSLAFFIDSVILQWTELTKMFYDATGQSTTAISELQGEIVKSMNAADVSIKNAQKEMGVLGDSMNKVKDDAPFIGDALDKALDRANDKGVELNKTLGFILNSSQSIRDKAVNIETIVAQATGTYNSIGAGTKFMETHADGGIVGGSSFSGDKVLSRLNSGEMVLNQAQQAALFKQANSPAQGANININLSGIMARSNGELREVAMELLAMINQGLQAKGVAPIGQSHSLT